MLGVPGLAGNTTTHPPDTSATSIDGGGAAGGGEAHQESGGCIMEFGGGVEGEQRGGGGGNRWPRQETMALLKIRSEMDAAFRDSSLKGPLWEEISRKMMELGYKRNAKKCREKFENVFKYHKRTKEGRSSKSEGKTYKFFDQLAALENTTTTPPSQSSLHHLPPPPPPPPPHSMAAQMQVVHADPISVLPPAPRASTPPNANAAQLSSNHHHHQNYANDSSSTSSDEDMERRRRRKRKRKEEEYFREAMKSVVDKQEELQKKFLETLEKKERERMMREEAWRNQEMERIKREYDLLAQERSMAAKRHSTLVSVLEKMTQQQKSGETNVAPSQQEKTSKNQCGTGFSITTNNSIINPFMTIYDGSVTTVTSVPQPAFASTTFPPPQLALTLTPPPPTIAPQPALPTPPPPRLLSPPPVMVPAAVVASAPQDHNGGGESSMSTTPSSRWPKEEIEELIKIRTSLDNKYQENGPKGPLWEEVSSEMNKLGYTRSSKRCKEKWENINKYFKKVKDNNKKRTEASKTCPYFHQLDALYKEKAKNGGNGNAATTSSDLNYSSYANAVNPDDNQMMHVVGQLEEDPDRGDVEYEDGDGEGHE